MALSGSYEFTLNRNELIYSALRVLSALEEGETPTAAQIEDAAQALNLMILSWQNDEIGLWLEQRATLFLVKGQQEYKLGPSGDHATLTPIRTALATPASRGTTAITVTAGSPLREADQIGVYLSSGSLQWTTINGAPVDNVVQLAEPLREAALLDAPVYAYTAKIQRPLEIFEARLRYEDGNEHPIFMDSRQDYVNLTIKSETGEPVQGYYDPQLTNGLFYSWPTADDEREQIVFSMKARFQDFDTATDNAQFPDQWLNALRWKLAEELIAEYDVPADRKQFIVAKAQMEYDKAKRFDVEFTGLRFEPDLKGYYRR